MNGTRSTFTVLVTIAAATLLFWLVLHQISAMWLDVALRPEVRRALEHSMEDQKALRSLDPAHREQYRRRFEESRRLLNRIQVIRLNREAMLHRFELALLLAFAFAAALAATLLWLRYRRAQAQERREYAERVQSLQETARRHVHEIKGPLTAARLEVERLAELARNGAGPEELARVEESVSEEWEFSTFGGLGTPLLRRESLGQMVDEFCLTFSRAWPGLALDGSGFDQGMSDAVVCADRDMLRQVLVNLCSNSAGAGATAVTLAIVRHGGRAGLDVRDDGAGVPSSLRARLFDPYVTTRRIGEGMGLGLSISRKVMLDHGGDLELVESSERGSMFRLTFGENRCS
jgi:signal transduction histidine kinase